MGHRPCSVLLDLDDGEMRYGYLADELFSTFPTPGWCWGFRLTFTGSVITPMDTIFSVSIEL
jgi:hypothetical protein